MFKWKVTGLGGGGGGGKDKDKNKDKDKGGGGDDKKLNNEVAAPEKGKKQDNNNRDGKDGEATNTSRFRFFGGGGGGGGNSSSASAIQNQNNAPATQPQRSSYDADTMSKVGQRLAAAPGAATTTTTSLPAAAMHSPGGVNHQQENPPPPQPMPKPGQWRNQQQLPPPPVPPHLHHLQQQHQVVPRPFQSPHPQQPPRMQPQAHHQPDEEAIPSDSLYGNGMSGSRADLSHWSSHGYLAKPQNNGHNTTQLNRFIDPSSGYVVLKRQPDPQPTSLPPPADPQFGEMDRKYFSVRGFSDMRNKHPDQQHSPSGNPNPTEINKYYSVDARYHSTKMQNLPPDLKLKLRQAQQQQQFPQQSGQYQYPPQPPPRNHQQQQQQQNTQGKPMPKQSSSSSKTTSSSWLEWTQQLQAYIAWVNSQLRKRPDLKPVQDLRTDLQSGEVLAQLIEIIAGEKISGIQYNPESIHGMRENLERILQFMAAKRIRMHQITSKEILEGNLKAVMRLILALAAHYKPQSVRHHDVSYESIDSGDINTNGHSGKASRARLNETAQLNDSSFDAGGGGNSEKANRVEVRRSASITQPTHTFKESMSTQTDAKSPLKILKPSQKMAPPQQQHQHPQQLPQNQQEVIQTEDGFLRPQQLQREESFVRTGSGRKLPKIPNASSAAKEEQEGSKLKDDFASKSDPRKSKPKALEFWESMENVQLGDGNSTATTSSTSGPNFRYNTIHRMSMGRRMLPKPPEGVQHHQQRSHSLDRSAEFHLSSQDDIAGEDDDMAAAAAAANALLNASFSGPTSLPISTTSSSQSPRGGGGVGGKRKNSESGLSDILVGDGTTASKFAPDGCSLQSSSSGGQTSGPASARGEVANSQPSPPSSDVTRGEVEGSSDNNVSPPTSVIQGESEKTNGNGGSHTYEWIKSGSTGHKWSVSKEFLSHHEELNSDKFSPKYSSNNSAKNSSSGGQVGPANGFHSLEEEVMFLRSLRMGGDGMNSAAGSSKQSDSMSDSGKSNGVSNGGSNSLPYDVLSRDLTQAKRQLLELHSLDCAVKHSGNGVGLVDAGGSENNAMKQNLARATLAKQALEVEKMDLMRKVEELEKKLSNRNGAAASADLKAHLEDLVKKHQQGQRGPDNYGTSMTDSDLRALYDEELAVAKDAISNLRTSFSGSDPNQHILDTLEQCISVIIEKIQHLDSLQQQQVDEKNSSRMSSLDYARVNDAYLTSGASSSASTTTKILYYTNRSATPFMSSVPKQIGDVTLRDFKNLFDRPGFFRFHFKSVDQEFGMVKEEITEDDTILPGADGKIVAWVDED